MEVTQPRAVTRWLVSVLVPCPRWEACRITEPSAAAIVARITQRTTVRPSHPFSAVEIAGRAADGSGTPATPYQLVANRSTASASAHRALTSSPTCTRVARDGGPDAGAGSASVDSG